MIKNFFTNLKIVFYFLMGIIPATIIIMLCTHTNLAVYVNNKSSALEKILCSLILIISFVIGFNLADRSTETKEVLDQRKEGMKKIQLIFSSVGASVLMWIALIVIFLFFVLKR